MKCLNGRGDAYFMVPQEASRDFVIGHVPAVNVILSTIATTTEMKLLKMMQFLQPIST